MGSTRHPYPATFRREAVELARTSDRSIRSLASDLGVDASTLRRWVQQAETAAGHATGQRSSALTTDERSELTRLRREVRVLEQEREILKKAAAFFARETW